LIKAWMKKVQHLHLYDYWSIPDWEGNLPDRDLLCEGGAKKISYWRQQGVEGALLESTNSSGAAGIRLYVFAHMTWDPKAERKPLLDEFFSMFGPVEPPMRRMMERWTRKFRLTRLELGKTYADLAEARRLAGNEAAVLRRVADYAIYVQFMRLRLENGSVASAKPAEQLAQTRKYLVYLWRQAPTTMVAPWRFTEHAKFRKPEVEAMLGWLEGGQFERAKPTAFWKDVTPITQKEALGWIDSGMAAYPKLDVERQFSERLVPLKPGRKPTGQFEQGMFLAGESVMTVDVPQGVTHMTFKIKNGALSVTSESGKAVPQDAASGETVVLKFPEPGRYQVQSLIGKTGGDLTVPRGVSLAFNSIGFAALSPRMYFYVPKGTHKVYLIGGCAGPQFFQILNPQGAPVKYDISDMTTFDVPAGMDGKIWSFQGLKGGYEGLNIPWQLAFSPDALLVPNNLLPELPRPWTGCQSSTARR
jgi:hypothetical protein